MNIDRLPVAVIAAGFLAVGRLLRGCLLEEFA